MGQLWMAYFVLCIGVIGTLCAHLFVLPAELVVRCLLLRTPSPNQWRYRLAIGLRERASHLLLMGVRLLLWLQPWLQCRLDVDPKRWTREGRFLLVANHRSHLDMFLLLSRVPRLRALTKKSLAWLPPLTPMIWATRQVLVKRKDPESFLRAMDLIRKGMSAGDSMLVFPEMTRCPEGLVGVQPFQLYPFHLARKESVKIIPIVIVGTDRVWPKGMLGLRFRKPVVIQEGEPIDAAAFRTSEELRDFVQNTMYQAFLRTRQLGAESQMSPA